MSGERSSRVIAADCNNRHPERPPISHSTVSCLPSKFRETGTVADKARSGRPKRATDETTAAMVLASFVKSPQRSTRRLSAECGISQSLIVLIVHAYKWQPFKIQLLQHLAEDDPDRRMQFCTWVLEQVEQHPSFAQRILFSDEANFYVSGEVNRHNHRYWNDRYPNYMEPSKVVGDVNIMVCYGRWGTRVIGPVFIDQNLNAQGYVDMLQDVVFPLVLNADGSFPSYFKQDGAPPHYGAVVRQWLDDLFPGLAAVVQCNGHPVHLISHHLTFICGVM